MDNFVTLDNIVSSILLEIGDEGNKRYAIKARQWALDEFRRVNVHLSDLYKERLVALDSNNAGQIPEESIKLISVGIYRNGVFDPFVKLANMEQRPEDMTDDIFNPATVNVSVDNELQGGYWSEDKEHGRFFVKNYNSINGFTTDTTTNIADRIIIRYRTTGLNLGGDIYIPYEAKDFIVATVALRFTEKGIPVRVTNIALQQMARRVDKLEGEYTALLYEPASFYEVMDAIFGRY